MRRHAHERVIDEQRQSAWADRWRDVGQATRLATAGFVGIILVAFAIDNRHEVRVGWIVGDRDAHLWLVIGASALVGAAIGALLTLRSRPR